MGVVLGAAVLAASPAGAPEGGEDELERLHRAIRESRERLSRYEREGRGLLETVEALDRAVSILAREVSAARRRAEQARAALAVIEAEAAELASRLARTERLMAIRAVALYKAGEVGAIRLLFSAGGLREFLSRVNALRLFLAHDAELLERRRAESEALASAESRARDAAADRDAALARLRERSGQLAAERRSKRRLAARLRADRAGERAALVELETAARALEETLATLRRAPRSSRPPVEGPPFATLKSRLEPPVAASIARGFGRVVDAEFQTETFLKGVEFDAPLGAPVRAVAAGQVRFAGWFRGYGKMVILDHGEQYFTVSGHLAEMKVGVGDGVRAGEIIGEVGDTGSLSGPRLYFEIRRGAEPLDPGDWLGSLDPG